MSASGHSTVNATIPATSGSALWEGVTAFLTAQNMGGGGDYLSALHWWLWQWRWDSAANAYIADIRIYKGVAKSSNFRLLLLVLILRLLQAMTA